jgi:hypothetical protein
MDRRFVVRDSIVILRNETHMRPRFGGENIEYCATVMISEPSQLLIFVALRQASSLFLAGDGSTSVKFKNTFD